MGFLGLIGPNGAGKTTFIDAISGFVRYTGSVLLDGRGAGPGDRRTSAPGWAWPARGSAIELFDDLDGAREHRGSPDNARRRWTPFERSSPGSTGAAPAASTTPSRSSVSKTKARRCRPICRRRIASSSGWHALLRAQPRLLCLDEPGSRSRRNRQRGTRCPSPRGSPTSGTALLLVDHDMGLVLLDLRLRGRPRVREGDRPRQPGQGARRNPAVITAYLGRAAKRSAMVCSRKVK